MDKFEIIDMDTWQRAAIYRLYTEKWPTTSYSLMKKLSVDKFVPYLKEKGIKFVPAIIWLVGREFNHIENFRLAVKDGKLGKWDVIHPLVPTLNKDKNMTFHNIRFEEDFGKFYEAYLQEQQENIEKTSLFANRVPDNFFMVSVFPFLHFDGGSMQVSGKGNYAPFVAIGKYNEEMLLPCVVMGNHAAQDAWHISEFFKGLQEGMDNPEEWCKIE